VSDLLLVFIYVLVMAVVSGLPLVFAYLSCSGIIIPLCLGSHVSSVNCGLNHGSFVVLILAQILAVALTLDWVWM
jgi:hypothetical protein